MRILDDRIIRNDWTRDYVAKFATPDKTVIEYPHAHHTLEFESDRTPWLNDVRDWLEKHSEPTTSTGNA
jgi:alpha-beta hydrolase superfamily lysophospholipase